MWKVHRRARRPVEAFVPDIGDDADDCDAAGTCAAAESEPPADRITIGEMQPHRRFIDNDGAGRAVVVRWQNVAAADEAHADGVEVAGRDDLPVERGRDLTFADLTALDPDVDIPERIGEGEVAGGTGGDHAGHCVHAVEQRAEESAATVVRRIVARGQCEPRRQYVLRAVARLYGQQ